VKVCVIKSHCLVTANSIRGLSLVDATMEFVLIQVGTNLYSAVRFVLFLWLGDCIGWIDLVNVFFVQ